MSYTLEIISKHKQSSSKSLKKYNVDGIETVGAFGDEPFEIRFKNNTYKKVQVKLSVDGTDILTGKPANTELSKDMWVVNGYDTLTLKAWPENSNGGSEFVFTSATNSVALHTHGDLSSRGIIAAAVFVEGYVEPVRYSSNHYYHFDSIPFGTRRSKSLSSKSCMPMQETKCINNSNIGAAASGAEIYSSDVSDSYDSLNESRSLESLVSVGAGQHINQKIVYVTGLTKPVFSETVRVKYLWWDDLVAKLRVANVVAPHPSGFPGDRNHNHIDLKGTPRIRTKKGSFYRSEEQVPVFTRF